MRTSIAMDDENYQKFMELSQETGVSISKLIVQYAAERMRYENGADMSFANLAQRLDELEGRVSNHLVKLESLIGGAINRLQFLTDLTGAEIRTILAHTGPDRTEQNSEIAAMLEREFWRIFTHTVKNAGWTKEATMDIQGKLSGEGASHAE